MIHFSNLSLSCHPNSRFSLTFTFYCFIIVISVPVQNIYFFQKKKKTKKKPQNLRLKTVKVLCKFHIKKMLSLTFFVKLRMFIGSSDQASMLTQNKFEFFREKWCSAAWQLPAKTSIEKHRERTRLSNENKEREFYLKKVIRTF